MSDTAQTVVEEPKVAAEPAAEAPDARNEDDLDTLLAQWDQQVEKPSSSTPEPKPDAKADTDLAKRLETLEQQLAAERFEKDIDPVIKAVRGDVPQELYDDNDIRDWIDRQAKADPRLANAWLNRKNDPQKFAKVVNGLGRKLQERFAKLPDKQATEDHAAVAAAVRGASTKAPEGQPPKFGNLSNADFAKEVEKNYGFNPGV